MSSVGSAKASPLTPTPTPEKNTADLSDQATAHSLPGALTGNLALHGRGGDGGQQVLVLPQRIDVAHFQHTTPLQHVVIGQLRQSGRRLACRLRR